MGIEYINDRIYNLNLSLLDLSNNKIKILNENIVNL
jgi:hypothetical protein